MFLLSLASWRVRQALFESPNASGRIQGISIKKQKLLAMGCVVVSFLLVTGGYKAVVEVAAEPTPTHQIDQILLDDIVNTASVKDVNALKISDGFKEYLASAIVECADLPLRQNLMWNTCADGKRVQLKDGTSVFSGIADFHDEFMTAWTHTVPKHLPAYIGYRFEMFSYFIFRTGSPDLEKISGNFHPKFGSYYRATAIYVDSMSDRWLSSLFCPGIYLLINIATLVGASKIRERVTKEHFLFGFWLSLASLFWLLSQIPIVPAPEYRYSYFSVVFTMLSLVFLASGLRRGQLIGSQEVANGERSE
ncbi:hypothetical protein [uncultured Varibaculum sp.]|uniref:hypothetical protein n=1 Tax=uncultured Varibaculum sp. TaxID=413896 RepID=UPI00258C9D7A|nr:hypothetical protein [uncultured Varibaculum sp.]